MKNERKQLITKDITFSRLLKKYPEASEILFKEGMMCVGCPMAMQETLGQGCEAHGLNVDRIIENINKKIANKK